MKRQRIFAGIQNRILMITLSCILGMCLIVSSVSYFIFQNYLKHSLIQSAETNLQLLSDTMNNSMEGVYQLVRFCQTNSDIADYVAKNSLSSASLADTVLAVSTYDRLSEEHSNNASSSYIPRLAVVTGTDFLQVVSATYSSTNNLAAEIPELPFFTELLENSSYSFSPGFIKDPFYRNGKQILPIIRPITYKYNSVQGGYLFMEVSMDLFTNPLQRYHLAEDSYIYLTLEDKHYLYEGGVFLPIDYWFAHTKELPSVTFTQNTSVQTVSWEDGSTDIVLTTPLNMNGCYLSQSISHSELLNQQLLFFMIIIGTLFAMIGIGLALMYLLNRMINVPVRKIRDKIQDISQGDFSRDSSIEWEHELGDIGRGINDLSENVVLLMEKRLEDEKQKRDLEYKVLQSQVNPHFLYNTLNSIKWMATVQGANGISEMTTALSRLMKSISKGTSLLISLDEELSLVRDYFTIQQYRYGGTISLDIQVADPSLYEYKIIKFTLQPLVENAIFHGIEPKGTAGKITILAGHEEDSIRIDVTDDGIGMSEEKIRQVLSSNSDSSSDFFKEIGISNVHKRLQYEFGEDYGISIVSAEGHFTTMTIRIPVQQVKKGDF